MPGTPAGNPEPLFASRFMAGFECASQRRRDGRRLDLAAATAHDRHARADYAAVHALGFAAARDGLRWHLIERAAGHYDWSSFLPMLRAADAEGLQVVWDLCHYGWPDGLDIWSAAFVERFARFAAAAAGVITGETGRSGFYCPINEISFMAWAGGEVGQFNPFGRNRGDELKRQLARASIAAIDAIRTVDPDARLVAAEPLIHVAAPTAALDAAAEAWRLAQYEACDMLAGRREPELGGGPHCLDVLGINFYPHNQWQVGGTTLQRGEPGYRPLRSLLAEVQARYRRPLFIAETGAEGAARAPWLRYVVDEVTAAERDGVRIEAICLYPILDYPGWDDDRHCETGLLGPADASGRRPLYQPLARELLLHLARQPPARPAPPAQRRRTPCPAQRVPS
jgi:hypothetical protein